MKTFTLKKEFLSSRCEICHKSDCYNAYLNSCSRCEGLVKEITKNSSNDPDGIVFFRSMTNFFSTLVVCMLSVCLSFFIFSAVKVAFSEYGAWPIGGSSFFKMIMFFWCLALPVVLVLYIKNRFSKKPQQ